MVSKRHDVGKVITTKSFYGSHSEMVVDLSEFDIKLEENEVICKDQDGFYVTFKNRIDSGLADPKRFHAQSRKNVNKRVEEVDNVNN